MGEYARNTCQDKGKKGFLLLKEDRGHPDWQKRYAWKKAAQLSQVSLPAEILPVLMAQ